MANLNPNTPIKQYRRKLFETLGSERYSRPYRRGVGRKIESSLPQEGFFIEAGATDGFSESNTYYLERFRNWRGILVEPIPDLYRKCLKERTKSKVYNYALVPFNYPDSHVEMLYGHLMSVVAGAFQSEEREQNHVAKAGRALGFEPYKIQVPARTLTSILDEAGVKEIDFFSLDVEGFELQVLKGLDLDRYLPKYMLVECWNEEYLQGISSYLSKYYPPPEQVSEIDYWFAREARG